MARNHGISQAELELKHLSHPEVPRNILQKLDALGPQLTWGYV